MKELIVVIDYYREVARLYYVYDGYVGRPAPVNPDDVGPVVEELTDEGWFVTQHVVGRVRLPEPAYEEFPEPVYTLPVDPDYQDPYYARRRAEQYRDKNDGWPKYRARQNAKMIADGKDTYVWHNRDACYRWFVRLGEVGEIPF